MSDYLPTIGLEVHAELKTLTKMFCDSANDPDEKRPNVNICPICMAHPGTLPVINKEAVRHVLRVGVAFGSQLADFTEFDRKNYFYPDIPKGYQISQYKFPLVSGGMLAGVAITRIHLEEDTARSIHDEKLAGSNATLIDYNRAGVPLMELVTEPVIHDAKTAGNFARELQLVLRYLGASEANMEKGQMRVEANISVVKVEGGKLKGEGKLGTKVEVKNLNSFRSVERAIEFEIARHIKVLEDGGTIVQETRGWDEGKQATYSQRKKESSHDYRYFPEPDLPKLALSEISEFSQEKLKAEMPELPWEKRTRYKETFGIKDEDIEAFVADPQLAAFFEAVTIKLAGNTERVKLATNYITTDLVGFAKKDLGDGESIGERIARSEISPEQFTPVIELLSEGTISSRGAKDIIAHLYAEGGDPRELADRLGLLQQSDEGELKKVVEAIIAENEKVVAEYKAGKISAMQFFVGQAMKATRGSANPQIVQKVVRELLE